MLRFWVGISTLALVVVAISFFTGSAAALTRPISIPCYFEGEIKSSEVVETDFKYKLVINPVEISDEAMCDRFHREVIEGYWYPPTAKLPSGELYKPDQPDVVIEQVLKRGTVVKGFVDSYDSTIEKVEVISFGVADRDDGFGGGLQNFELFKGNDPQIMIVVVGIFLVVVVGFIFVVKRDSGK